MIELHHGSEVERIDESWMMNEQAEHEEKEKGSQHERVIEDSIMMMLPPSSFFLSDSPGTDGIAIAWTSM